MHFFQCEIPYYIKAEVITLPTILSFKDMKLKIERGCSPYKNSAYLIKNPAMDEDDFLGEMQKKQRGSLKNIYAFVFS